MVKVDVIIPSYMPDKSFLDLIDLLEQQSFPVQRIIIMNTEEKYYDKLVYENRFLEKYANLVTYHISKKEFDHGMTRRVGVSKSDADIFVMMTQDAMPKDAFLIEKLVKALEPQNVAAAYARQLPREDCSEAEKFMREFNYPAASRVKSISDIQELGIKTYFCSNVCCAYKRDIYEKVGGFEKCTIFNEDMLYAAKAMKAGYKIAYAAEAEVVHSHNYTCKQQFKRNFDLGVSQAEHPEVFENVPSEKEGIRSVKLTMKHLREKGMRRKIPYVILQSGCKYMGYFLGKRHKKLPQKLVMKCTSNEGYWANAQRRSEVKSIDASKGYGRADSERGKK